MIIPVRDKSGKITGFRTPLVGYIKNNFLRKLCMVIFTPYIIVMTLAVNVLVATTWYVVFLARSVKVSLKPLYTRGKYWDKPRIKGVDDE